jgi:hypothetical protein
MDDQLSAISFGVMSLLVAACAFMFYLLIKLSLKIHDLNYYVNRPKIPYQAPKDDPYKINSLTQALI